MILASVKSIMESTEKLCGGKVKLKVIRQSVSCRMYYQNNNNNVISSFCPTSIKSTCRLVDYPRRYHCQYRSVLGKHGATWIPPLADTGLSTHTQ